MKRLISILIILCLVLAFTPGICDYSWAFSGNTGNGLSYSLDDDGTLTISGNGPMADSGNYDSTYYSFRDRIVKIVIEPGVTSIGSGTFKYLYNLKEISLPDTLTKIGERAFTGCSALTSVEIPGSVTEIGDFAFKECDKLTTVVLHDGVAVIGKCAFRQCYNLSDLVIPTSVTSIGGEAFYNCGITELIISDSVTNMGSGAFGWCNKLEKVTIGSGLSEISDNAFSACHSLTDVTIGNNITKIGSGAFMSCSGLKAIALPEGITYIGDRAFCSCNELTAIDLPEPLTYIGNEAFFTCNGLTEVIFPKGVSYIGDNAFRACTGLTEIELPDGITSVGGAFSDCTGLIKVTIPDSVTSMAGTFAGCTGLKEVSLPDGLTSLSGTFSRCTGLTDIVLPENVNHIGEYTFYQCTGLTELAIPENVTEIGAHAFEGCTGLTELVIPEKVTKIGTYAFENCTGITKLIIPDSVTEIGNNAFGGCTGLTELTIGNNVKTIGDGAFIRCSGLTEIIVPNSVNSLGPSAFAYCTGIKEATIGDSVAGLEILTFSSCSSLEKVTIGEKAAFIRGGAFTQCLNLKEVIFKGGAPIIDDNTFKDITAKAYYPDDDPTWAEDILKDYGGDITWEPYSVPDEVAESGQCGDNLTYTRGKRGKVTITGTGPMWDYSDGNPAPWKGLATSVTIDEGVTTIGNYAFAGCTKLVRVDLPDTLTSIGDFSFHGNQLITEITFPGGLKSIGQYAFQQCEKLKRVFFLGSAPVIGKEAFWGDNTAAYYFDSDDTWYNQPETNLDPRQDYGGRICWAGWMADPDIPERMAGTTRQTTAVEISKATFANGTDNIVIASGDNYPDALAGGPLAYLLDAPILLVRKSQPDAETLAEISRLGAKHAYILGGTGAVGDNVADVLRSKGLTVERISGPTRFETATAVAEKIDELCGDKPASVFFVYSHNYPDALAVSNVAAITGSPILYIEGSGVMRECTKKYMDSCGKVDLNVILGGPALINSKAETSLGKYGQVERIYGKDRYETCININIAFKDILDGDSVCVACGTNYPDALSGSVFAANCRAPLLLVRGNSLSSLQEEYAHWKAPVNVFAFGGTGALSQAVVDAVKQNALRYDLPAYLR